MGGETKKKDFAGKSEMNGNERGVWKDEERNWGLSRYK